MISFKWIFTNLIIKQHLQNMSSFQDKTQQTERQTDGRRWSEGQTMIMALVRCTLLWQLYLQPVNIFFSIKVLNVFFSVFHMTINCYHLFLYNFFLLLFEFYITQCLLINVPTNFFLKIFCGVFCFVMN